MMRFMWIVVFVFVKCSAMSSDELEDFSDYLKKTSQLDLNVRKGADPDDIFDEEDEISEHAWEDSGKFEGDLILNDRQRRLIVENVEGLSRNGLTDSTKRWPNNEVIYFIQKEHFNGAQVQAIHQGIEDLAQASCVKFRPYKKGDRDAVVIQGSRRGCFSQVGYQGGYQVLNLSGRHPAGRGCFRHGTVVHELLHTLGFYHMQSSPDRDDYIDVRWENILQPARHNFRKYNSFSVSDFGVGYDYDSVLHYSRRAFSSNGKDTLVPKQRGASIGQRVGLSDKDTAKLNKMYCDAESLTFDEEESTQKPKIKRKKPKNKPFQGHGIGYHQGKTVVIKVPTAQTYKLPNVPSIHVFDFSGAPQALQTPESEDYRIGKEVNYPHKVQDGREIAKHSNSAEELDNNSQKHETNNSSEEDNNDSTSKEEKLMADEEELDESLNEAFDRLALIAKKRIYPEYKEYNFKVNEDFSTFFSPTERTKQELPDPFNGNYKESSLYIKPITNSDHIMNKNSKKHSLELSEPVYYEGHMDQSYRTSLPNPKPYSFYKQTETPKYASLEYLQDRHNYSDLYTRKTKEGPKRNGPHTIFHDDVPTTDDEWYKKESQQGHPAKYESSPYSESAEDETSVPEEDGSSEYYDENTKDPTKKSEVHSYGDPTPSQKWYKPNYSSPDYRRDSYKNERLKSHEFDR